MTTLDLWASDFTPEVIALAKTRILDGGNLATHEDLPRRTIKLALIVVRQLNDRERLTQEEEAVLLGITRDTLRKLKADTSIPALVNW
jgi:DNA-binding XRE family transcriptional regulator